MDKDSVRKAMLDKRRGLSPAQAQDMSERAVERLADIPGWDGFETVVLYWPLGNELDVSPLLSLLVERGTGVYLPRCRAGKNGEMDMFRVRDESDLEPGMHGIMEPVSGLASLETAPDLILVPGVAFDRQGFRLGFGGGYYDRYLARFPSVVAVGMCYGFQMLDSLPRENHDIPVNYICNERELLKICQAK